MVVAACTHEDITHYSSLVLSHYSLLITHPRSFPIPHTWPTRSVLLDAVTSTASQRPPSGVVSGQLHASSMPSLFNSPGWYVDRSLATVRAHTLGVQSVFLNDGTVLQSLTVVSSSWNTAYCPRLQQDPEADDARPLQAQLTRAEAATGVMGMLVWHMKAVDVMGAEV